MKKRLIFILLFCVLGGLLLAQIKLEGYLEGSFGKTYDNDIYEWNTWDPNFYLESRIIANPVANSEMYLKFYSDKDNDYYRYDSFNSEAVFTEGHISYRQEGNNKGFSATLFSRESGHYWTDGSLLGLVYTGSVNNDGNGQGVRFDVWHPYNGSMTYVFSDFSQGAGDDIHLFRYRQSLHNDKIKTGLFLQQKNFSSGKADEYNRIIASDLSWQFGRYFFNGELAISNDPSNKELEELNNKYEEGGISDILKRNFAAKMEFSGLRVGTSGWGYWFFKPGVYNYGTTYRNYMGENKSNEHGFWLNSYYLLPKRAVTLTVNYSAYEKIVPDTMQVIASVDSGQVIYKDDKIYNPTTTLYSEIYVEFVKGFKGKFAFTKTDDKWQGVLYKHYDLFSELSVENRLAKLLTQFKIKDLNETSEKQIAGIELSVNLSDRWKLFARGMIANDRVGSRHSIFGEVQYRLGGNTEVYLQYGPSWWGQYGLVNDDSFASGGEMQKEIKLIIKGWF